MAGILIYVAVPDEEGSLGGLMELAKPHQFLRLLTRALESAAWCSLDPVLLGAGRTRAGSAEPRRLPRLRSGPRDELCVRKRLARSDFRKRGRARHSRVSGFCRAARVMPKRKFELPGIQDLSKEQEAARVLPKKGQHLIVGGPGTGEIRVSVDSRPTPPPGSRQLPVPGLQSSSQSLERTAVRRRPRRQDLDRLVPGDISDDHRPISSAQAVGRKWLQGD